MKNGYFVSKYTANTRAQLVSQFQAWLGLHARYWNKLHVPLQHLREHYNGRQKPNDMNGCQIMNRQQWKHEHISRRKSFGHKYKTYFCFPFFSPYDNFKNQLKQKEHSHTLQKKWPSKKKSFVSDVIHPNPLLTVFSLPIIIFLCISFSVVSFSFLL